MAINPNPLGAVADSNGNATLKLLSIGLSVGDLLVVSIVGVAPFTTNVTWQGNALNVDDTAVAGGINNPKSNVLSLAITVGNVGTGSGDIVWTDNSLAKAMAAIQVSGLTNHAKDQQAQAQSFAGSSSPQSGNTPATTVANEFVYCAVGTGGPSTDAPGTWDPGYTAGSIAGTCSGVHDVTISDAYQVVTGQALPGAVFHAGKTGCTSRPWTAICVTYS